MSRIVALIRRVLALSSARLRTTVPTVLLLLVAASANRVQAQTFTVLHKFSGFPIDGKNPLAGVIIDGDGNLYGTTPLAGKFGGGTVYKVDPAGAESVLHDFYKGNGGVRFGWNPMGGLVLDATGDIFGTTNAGGDTSCNPGGCGTVFKLDTSSRLSVLHRFDCSANGCGPIAGVVRAANGVKYGITPAGGAFNQGTVFALSGANKFTVLHAFTGGADGGFPQDDLTMDAQGNLYGTTTLGGIGSANCNPGCGVVFKINKSGQETVLYSFTGGTDGSLPNGGVTLDAGGNLYGTTDGAHDTIYKLDSAGNLTVLYTFTGGTDGLDPEGTLVRDSAGNLYGATRLGGAFGHGTVFVLDTSGNEKILHSFSGGNDGNGPFGTLAMDGLGNLYGTTFQGGDLNCQAPKGCGTVFKITP
jgi:uncharacterized repeat protein (TIGR03803 family)